MQLTTRSPSPCMGFRGKALVVRGGERACRVDLGVRDEPQCASDELSVAL